MVREAESSGMPVDLIRVIVFACLELLISEMRDFLASSGRERRSFLWELLRLIEREEAGLCT